MCLSPSSCQTSKAKARHWPGGVHVRVRVRSCCVGVQWSLSEVTCMVVCHCGGCFGGRCQSCCRFVSLPLIVSRGPKKNSLVYVVGVTPYWFTTSPFQSNCMCVLMTILLFCSINACPYFQFLFHFVAQNNALAGTLSVKFTQWLTEMKLHLP